MQLQIDNLTKTYPNGTKALDSVTLTIEPGMFGLLGPNGAGKSTLMRTIATLQQADAGSITFDGINVFKQPLALRNRLGYLPQEFGVYPSISADRLLDYFASLKGVNNSRARKELVNEVLEITNLKHASHRAVSGYSGGMRQRFGIAQMLLNNPDLIIVDEPTAGLDPAERHRFLNVLRSLGKDRIVIFSTHIVDDVKDICTDMAILTSGSLRYHASPAEAIGQVQGRVWRKTIEADELSQFEQDYAIISSGFEMGDRMRIRVLSDTPPAGFEAAEPQLEDVYFIHLNDLAAQPA